MRALIILAALAVAPATTLSAQNTNQDAPRATHKLEFGGDAPLSLSVSYQQLSLAGGQSLKSLTSKGPRGDAIRKFYNEQYLPNFLKGKLVTEQAMGLQGKPLAAGSYGFTFRIDDELKWHLVISSDDEDVLVLPLNPDDRGGSPARRLTVEPIAANDDQPQGHLVIRYGQLFARVPFAAPEKGPGDGDRG